LRASGAIAAKRAQKLSAETLRRARLAYRALRVHSDDRSAAPWRRTDRNANLRWGRALAIAIVPICAALGWVASFLGGYAAAAITAMVAIAGSLLLLRRVRVRAAAPGVDPEGIALKFAAFFAARAARLPEGTVGRLDALGKDLSEVLAELPAAHTSGVWTADDVALVRNVVADHLPNAIDPYLSLRRPTDQHEHLLSIQLERLHSEMRAMLSRLEAARGQRLARNATFLERKLGS